MNLNGKALDAIAILVFIGITYIFFGKLYTGNILLQTDIQQYQGMSAEIEQYREQGENIHWTNSAFSGMPTYLLGDAMYRNQNLPQFINYTIRKIFPGATGILLIGLISFYILLRSLKIDRWLSIIGSFAFGAGSFVIISLIAGHTSKINAFAYAPLILAGLILIFRKKPWSGVFFLAYGLGAQIAANHLQITFYTFLICLTFVIVELVQSVMTKDKAIWKPFVLSALSVFIAVGINYNKLYSVYQYSKHSTRSGKSIIEGDSVGKDKAYDYATQWSYQPLESLTLLIPNIKGGASNEELGEKSSWYGNSQVPRQFQNAPPTYWGQMPFTAGPVYIGASLIALFFFSFLFVKNRWKWWIGLSVLLLLLLSWGKFSPVYDAFYFGFPFFDKFRTPMMALLMMSILFPLLTMQGLQKSLFNKEVIISNKQLLIGFGIPVVLILLFGFLGANMYSYEGAVDANLKEAGFPRNLIQLLHADRKSLLMADSVRSVIFVLLTAASVWAFVKQKIKKEVLIGAIALLTFLDLYLINQRYTKDSQYISKDRYEQQLEPTSLDNAITKDAGLYDRVLDITRDPYTNALTSLHHKSLGGYHAAKLQSYDDLITLKLRQFDISSINMLNTAYIINQNEEGQVGIEKNSGALGNAWFVSTTQSVNTAKEAMDGLSNIEVGKTALVENGTSKNYSIDSASNATIKLSSYHPEKLVYNSTNEQDGFAVFSEIYYKQQDGDGWQAFIDGEKTPITKTNFLLRGLEIPKGNHEIVFEYKKSAFQKRSMASRIFSGILFLSALGYFASYFYRKN